jgi:hypothetical protein
MKKTILKEFQKIPGVGKSISQDFYDLGLRSISDLKKHSPDELYNKLCKLKNTKIDKCMLYVLRCAIYYATEKDHDPELLKWWNWKK